MSVIYRVQRTYKRRVLSEALTTSVGCVAWVLAIEYDRKPRNKSLRCWTGVDYGLVPEMVPLEDVVRIGNGQWSWRNIINAGYLYGEPDFVTHSPLDGFPDATMAELIAAIPTEGVAALRRFALPRLESEHVEQGTGGSPATYARRGAVVGSFKKCASDVANGDNDAAG